MALFKVSNKAYAIYKGKFPGENNNNNNVNKKDNNFYNIDNNLIMIFI